MTTHYAVTDDTGRCGADYAEGTDSEGSTVARRIDCPECLFTLRLDYPEDFPTPLCVNCDAPAESYGLDYAVCEECHRADSAPDPRDVFAAAIAERNPGWTVTAMAGEYVRITHNPCGFHAPAHDSLASSAITSHTCQEG